MARTHDDIERYILSSNYGAEQASPGTWVLRDPQWGGAQIVVHHNDPLVVYRVKLFDIPAGLPADRKSALLSRLLELNGTEMLQGAYALEGNAVVAVEVMQAENLDQNEFDAALDSLTLSIVDHRDEFLTMLAA
ncbi:MAG: hypothetical protein FJ100_17710 [Deltaproteobacteria bacterium]|nr:hypothetical protein [Deltaproteobacteria bacterium]